MYNSTTIPVLGMTIRAIKIHLVKMSICKTKKAVVTVIKKHFIPFLNQINLFTLLTIDSFGNKIERNRWAVEGEYICIHLAADSGFLE